MPNDEQQLAGERNQQRMRAEQLSSSVIPLLRQLAPTAPVEALEAACKEVVVAVLGYEAASLSAKSETLAKRRRSLRQMNKAFEECLRVVDPSNLPSRVLFDMRFAQLRHQGGSLDKLRYQLRSAIAAAEASLENLSSQVGHSADENVAELAAKLRWTLAKTLGLTPVMKPDSLLKSANQGTAANYARLLRLAITLAGRDPPDDLQHIMERGRERLRIQGVVQFEKMVTADYPEGVNVLGYGKFDTK